MPCCVPNCLNGSRLTMDRNTTFHNFPHPTKEPDRFDKWVTAINSPKVLKKNPISVFKQFRVCRKHFDQHSFNGICKRLLKNSVPTLFLKGCSNINQKPLWVTPTANILNSVDYRSKQIQRLYDDGLKESEPEPPCFTYFEIVDSQEAAAMEETYINEEEQDEEEEEMREEEEFEYEEHEVISKEQFDNIEEVDEEDMIPQNVILLNNDRTASAEMGGYINAVIKREFVEQEIPENGDEFDECDDNEVEDPTEMFDIIDVIEDYIKAPLNEENFKQWRKDFYSDPKNILAQNICSRVDPFEVCLSRRALEKTQHFFNYKVETEGKPLTNQKSSGRCWIFAALNVIRIPFAKEMKLEEFEFSQSYLFYWDKIERCHYFLNNIVETSHRGEEVDGRLISFLLQDPTCDGGQWDMICNLINKYGLMPKKCFPESFSCESSHNMNAILKSKLREYARILHEMVQTAKDEEDIRKTIQKQMTEVYNIVGICLGIPPEQFTWEYYAEKSKEYKRVGPITALEFYEKLVQPVFDINNKVCIVTDPRPTSSYGKAYTVDCLGNVVGGRPVLYNNQIVDVLMDLVKASLQKGEPVWFGCEVSKRFAGKLGIEDLEIHDFKVVFNVDIQITMSKADRLRYGESAMTHAMSFTAVAVDEEDKAIKFRVENSWGEDRGEKGYLIMSADWFKEFVFEIVVDKSLVPSSIMKVFEMTPIVLPAWDPMGTLAKDNVE